MFGLDIYFERIQTEEQYQELTKTGWLFELFVDAPQSWEDHLQLKKEHQGEYVPPTGRKKRVKTGFWNKPTIELAICYPPEFVNSADGYIQVVRDQKRIKLHRLIWTELIGKIPPGYEIDHINGNRVDNRLENLRVVSRATNTLNKKMSARNTSGYTGVGKGPKDGYWLAKWTKDGIEHSKCFSGELAFERAVAHREAMIQELREEGYPYTDRHGK